MRKLLIGLLAAALVLFGALLPLVLPRHCPVNRTACERIKEGMTQTEVEAILGGPPGDYTTRPTIRKVGSLTPPRGAHSRSVKWWGDEGDALVWFGDGVVIGTIFREAEVTPVSLGEMLFWRLDKILSFVERRAA
jgi:hypothetical protein